MRLIIVRHGLAVDREDFIKTKKDDSLRPLTEKGREKSWSMAKNLSARFDEDAVPLIVTSPYLRAKQTAQIFQEVLKPKSFLESVELVPAAPPEAFGAWLRAHVTTENTVLAVGHEPQLSTFASWCLAGVQESFIDLKKSGVLALDFESFQTLSAGCAELKWLLQPKWR